jgi:hypothetical protein
MDNLITIANQRAERTKAHRYSTPLPFDSLAKTANHHADLPFGNPARYLPIDHVDQNSSSSPSKPSRASGETNSTEPSTMSDDTEPELEVMRAKHIPMHKIIDFRVAHSYKIPKRGSSARTQQQLPSHPKDHSHVAPKQRVIRDGVPHLMERRSDVLVENVEGVPLTSNFYPQTNAQNDMTIPETEAEIIRSIDLPNEEELSLEAEYDTYRKHHARAPPPIWHGNHSVENVAAMNLPYRPRQISPRPFSRGTEHTFVDGYSNHPLLTKHEDKSSQRKSRWRQHGVRWGSSSADKAGDSAAPAPNVPRA